MPFFGARRNLHNFHHVQSGMGHGNTYASGTNPFQEGGGDIYRSGRNPFQEGGGDVYGSGRNPFQEGGARTRVVKRRALTDHEKYCTKKLHAPKNPRKRRLADVLADLPEVDRDRETDVEEEEEEEEEEEIIAPPPKKKRTRKNTKSTPTRRSARLQKGDGILPGMANLFQSSSGMVPSALETAAKILCRTRRAARKGKSRKKRAARKKQKTRGQRGGIFKPVARLLASIFT